MGGGGINNVTAIDIHTVLFPASVRIPHPAIWEEAKKTSRFMKNKKEAEITGWGHTAGSPPLPTDKACGHLPPKVLELCCLKRDFRNGGRSGLGNSGTRYSAP